MLTVKTSTNAFRGEDWLPDSRPPLEVQQSTSSGADLLSNVCRNLFNFLTSGSRQRSPTASGLWHWHSFTELLSPHSYVRSTVIFSIIALFPHLFYQNIKENSLWWRNLAVWCNRANFSGAGFQVVNIENRPCFTVTRFVVSMANLAVAGSNPCSSSSWICHTFNPIWKHQSRGSFRLHNTELLLHCVKNRHHYYFFFFKLS